MGFSLGLLGGGGSILSVPILVYVFGTEPHAAIAISLVLVGSTAMGASLLHHREGMVDWRAGFLFALCAAPGSLIGARIAMRMPGQLLLLLFGMLMLGAGAAMLRRRSETAAQPHIDWLPLTLSGVGVGFLTGFLGAGGGFLIVPALVLFLGRTMRQAVGTSLFVIALNCCVALWGHRAALHMQWSMVGWATLAALVGTIGGVVVSRRMSTAQLRRAFAVFVILLGAVMIARNAAALGR